jgi:galactoside O-acetyltransferase
MKFKLIIYYLIIARLPNSANHPCFNRFRVWYISRILKIMEYDKRSIFENNIYISNGKNVTIGNECEINDHVFIQGARIGSYVMIAPHAAILNSIHNHKDISTPMIRQGARKNLNPIIEDDVWIGRNAVIMPGVRIAKGTIIGAGAVLTGDTEEYSVYGGVPARLIGKR